MQLCQHYQAAAEHSPGLTSSQVPSAVPKVLLPAEEGFEAATYKVVNTSLTQVGQV